MDIAAATIIGKRVIVPLIATPLANKVKDWMNKDEVKSGQKDGNQKEAPAVKVDEAKVSVVAQNLDTGSTNLLAKYKQK